MNKTTEITFKAIILGFFLSILLSAANTYLGLFAGMTVSASIPAAIMSMTILKLFKNSTIHENNLVQTAASAGESLAAGVIFTFPALLLLGYWTNFNYIEVTKIALIGGILGVLFTIPLRKTLIIDKKLKFPEGIATSKILESAHSSKLGQTILLSGFLSALIKFFQQGLKLWNSSTDFFFRINNSIYGIGCDFSPALIGVGYIVGLNVGILVLLGGIISWLIAIPIYTSFNFFDGDLSNIAWTIWNEKIRFLGVGAMLIGGMWSIIRLLRPIFLGLVQNYYKSEKENNDIPFKFITFTIIFLILPIFLIYNDILKNTPISIIITILIIFISFFFTAVAAYMAGIVGSSNNPISGITIATILLSALFIKYIGFESNYGMIASVLFGAIICCSSAIGGDNMQDLKTGHLIGATPWKQQIMQIIGTTASALTITFTLNVLHSAYIIGSETLPAPQANLMKIVVEAVFNKSLPWEWIYMGIFIGTIVIIIDYIQEVRKSNFRFPVLAVAVGIYLPIGLSLPIFLGSLINYINKNNEKGILYSSGLITGEAIMGILIAVPIFLTGSKNWWLDHTDIIGFICFISIIYLSFKISKK